MDHRQNEPVAQGRNPASKSLLFLLFGLFPRRQLKKYDTPTRNKLVLMPALGELMLAFEIWRNRHSPVNAVRSEKK